MVCINPRTLFRGQATKMGLKKGPPVKFWDSELLIFDHILPGLEKSQGNFCESNERAIVSAFGARRGLCCWPTKGRWKGYYWKERIGREGGMVFSWFCSRVREAAIRSLVYKQSPSSLLYVLLCAREAIRLILYFTYRYVTRLRTVGVVRSCGWSSLGDRNDVCFRIKSHTCFVASSHLIFCWNQTQWPWGIIENNSKPTSDCRFIEKTAGCFSPRIFNPAKLVSAILEKTSFQHKLSESNNVMVSGRGFKKLFFAYR